MKKILIVEDVNLNLELLTQLLENTYTLISARDGAQAVAMAGQQRPDLILMDILLPVMDGLEATRRIKANPRLRQIPIIAVSANAMPADIDAALAAGCSDYLTKPLDDKALFAALARYL
jgi:CheY-like chemotaxis protein